MAYLTWDEVAEAVQGEERLQSMLLPRIETEDDHPFFDQQLAVAQRRADVELEQAGYEVPLDSVTDPLLKNAIIGLLVGLLTEASSGREPFMDALYKAALEYFKRLGKGTITVLGAEVDDTPETESLMLGTTPDRPVFDYSGGADAEILHVLAPLGSGRAGWRR
jgi:hypothetical protein